MTRTALFGGSFDPVHMGHAMLANFVAGTGLVDEVWFMPVESTLLNLACLLWKNSIVPKCVGSLQKIAGLHRFAT